MGLAAALTLTATILLGLFWVLLGKPPPTCIVLGVARETTTLLDCLLTIYVGHYFVGLSLDCLCGPLLCWTVSWSVLCGPLPVWTGLRILLFVLRPLLHM